MDVPAARPARLDQRLVGGSRARFEDDLLVLGEERRQLAFEARFVPRILRVRAHAADGRFPVPRRERAHELVQLATDACGERARVPREIVGLGRGGSIRLRLAGPHPLLPLLDEARVDAGQHRAEETDRVPQLVVACGFRDRLHERVVELREIAEQQSFAALEAVTTDVVVEVLVALPHLAGDGLRAQALLGEPRVLLAEEREARVQELLRRFRMRHLRQLRHPLVVVDAFSLPLRDQLSLRALHLLLQDCPRVFEDGLDQRHRVARIVRRFAIQQSDGVDEIQRQGLVQREVPLQVRREPHRRRAGVDVEHPLDEPGAAQRPEQAGGVAPELALARRRLVAALDEFHEQAIARAARVFVDAALQARHQRPVSDPEPGSEHLGRTRRELLEGLLRPRDVARRRLLLDRALLAAARRLGLDAFVLDHVLRCLAHDPAAFVEALAPGAPGDLPEVAHGQQTLLLAVELDESREQHRADRDVDPHAQRIGAADDPQQSLLRELLDEQTISGQQTGVVQTDALPEHALHVLAVRRVEADPGERLGDRLPLLPRRHLGAGERLRLLGRFALREEHDVHRRARLREQVLDGLVQRRLAPLELERHRTIVAVYVRHGAAGGAGELLLDRRRVAERRRHQQERRPLQQQQRDLPRGAAGRVRVEVELIHHDVRGVGGLTLAQRHVGEDLGRAADDRRRPVDAGIAGEHAHVLRAQLLAQREELLAGERLQRRRVERSAPLAQRLPVQRQRDQRLARAGRRRQHHVLARPRLEDRLLLRGIEREPGVLHPGDETIESLHRVAVAGSGEPVPEAHGGTGAECGGRGVGGHGSAD